MAAALGDLDAHRARGPLARQHARAEEWVVERLQDQRRPADVPQLAARVGALAVLATGAITADRGGVGVTELEEVARREDGPPVELARPVRRAGLAAQQALDVAQHGVLVHAPFRALQVLGAAQQLQRRAHRDGRVDRRVGAVLTQCVQHDAAAKRPADHHQGPVRPALAQQAAGVAQVRGVGVVQDARLPVRLGARAAQLQHHAGPAERRERGRHRAHVARMGAAAEAVHQHGDGPAQRLVQPGQLDEIVVRRRQPLHARQRPGAAAHHEPGGHLRERIAQPAMGAESRRAIQGRAHAGVKAGCVPVAPGAGARGALPE
jgi:hypothetical protein